LDDPRGARGLKVSLTFKVKLGYYKPDGSDKTVITGVFITRKYFFNQLGIILSVRELKRTHNL
jgi:hypothetical protein